MTKMGVRFGIHASLIVMGGLMILLGLSNCSEQRHPSDLPGTHPASWSDSGSPDFHGQAVYKMGVGGCSSCHGEDLDGGEVNVSCIDCHLASGACASCHGGQENETGAPPIGLHGETEPTSRAVGAHTVHLSGSALAGPIECEFCHIVPLFTLDSSHYDGQTSPALVDSIAELTFGGYADGGGGAWNHESATCQNIYCHGQFAGGKNDNNPVWTDTVAECGSCHAYTHVGAINGMHEFHVFSVGLICNDCHANVIDTDLTMIAPGLHVNGLVDTATARPEICANCHGANEGSCVSCHGGQDNNLGAPPTGLRHEAATSERAVGAHTVHLAGAAYSTGFPCSSCHLLPVSLADAGHLDPDSIAELTWSALAGGESHWDRASRTCADTYCHGNFAGGDRTNRPVWTGTDQAACGSCHDIGSNPEQLGWKHSFHVANAGLTCGDCHANVVDTNLNLVELSLHVNGQADTLTRDETICKQCHGSTGSTCTVCHGGVDNQTGAPPTGLNGVLVTDSIGVGAHTTHVDGGALTDPIDCSTCHVVPLSIDSPGHMEVGWDGIAEINWSGLAGDSATWDHLNATCENSYCHGKFSGGYANNRPIWTGSDQATCGSCHDVGSDSAALNTHHEVHVGTFGFECYHCHGNVVDLSLNITDRSRHVNGVVDTYTPDPALCESCHGTGPDACVHCHGGTDNVTGAPPQGLRGETATTDRAVGAHTAHLEGRLISDGVPCTECHLYPINFSDPGHYDSDSIAELTWGFLAGASSSWNRTTRTCSDTYCHGNFPGGYNGSDPLWTGSAQGHCGSCHDYGLSPGTLLGRHAKHVNSESIPCAACHFTTVDEYLTIIGPDLHVNGIFEVVFETGNPAVWNGSRCTNNACHENANW